MAKSNESGMWNLVMFDLPVKTKLQRTHANNFRKLLIDLGWSREQYSVYVRLAQEPQHPGGPALAVGDEIPQHPLGKVEVLAITDRQWSKALRFFNAQEESPLSAPDLLTLF